jgi:hypothetical protein
LVLPFILSLSLHTSLTLLLLAQSLHLGKVLPKFPPKTVGSKLSQKEIEERRAGLEAWIQALVNHSQQQPAPIPELVEFFRLV